jgi:preprotein translocase subunit SecE
MALNISDIERLSILLGKFLLYIAYTKKLYTMLGIFEEEIETSQWPNRKETITITKSILLSQVSYALPLFANFV